MVSLVDKQHYEEFNWKFGNESELSGWEYKY